jgi:hypothetical protein
MSAQKDDNLTRAGAARLCSKIEYYWRQRGEKVKVWVEQIGIDQGFAVRSNMVNGAPR